MEELVFLNENLVPKDRAAISVSDYGFLYGFGLFETMRAYNGTVFRLDAHLQRLEKAASNLEIPVDIAYLNKAVIETIEANKLENVRIRVTVSAGEGSIVPDLTSCKEPTVLVVASEYHPFSEERYTQGFRLVTSHIPRYSRSSVITMKSTNYLESLLARHRARAAGYDEALLLNESGMVAEASTSNIFMVTGGTLKTPGTDSGILPGVTRDIVLELAHENGIKAEESEILLDELKNADEVFITNSIMEIMPVSEIDGVKINDGGPGDITLSLMQAYKELVSKET